MIGNNFVWQLYYLEEVEIWLDKLDQLQYKSVAKEIRLIEMAGNKLRLPHSKALGNGLFELRERSNAYRLYYTFCTDEKIFLLRAGNKSTQKVDIKYARSILRKLKEEISK